jgi:RNA-directed DNA polymerase
MEISYKTHSISKGNGKYRTIYEPNIKLKEWQLETLQEMYEVQPHPCNHGFVPNKSISTNAQEHINKNFVLSMDIKSFFPNTTEEKVGKILTRFFPNWVEFLPRFVWKNHLPQGAPTSPYVANFALWDFDISISEMCKEKQITYTRYADDLTFSYDDKSNTKLLFSTINKELNAHGYWLSKNKTHLMPYWKRQKVTGFIVNKKLNLPLEVRNQLRAYNHLNQYGKWDQEDSQWLNGMNGYGGMVEKYR